METNQISYSARVWNGVETFLKRRLREGASDLQSYLSTEILQSPECEAIPNPAAGSTSMYLTTMVRSGLLVREVRQGLGSRKIYGYRLPRAGEALPEKGWKKYTPSKSKKVAKSPARSPFTGEPKTAASMGTTHTPQAAAQPSGRLSEQKATVGWHTPTLQELMALDVSVRGDGKGLSFRLGQQRYRFGVD